MHCLCKWSRLFSVTFGDCYMKHIPQCKVIALNLQESIVCITVKKKPDGLCIQILSEGKIKRQQYSSSPYLHIMNTNVNDLHTSMNNVPIPNVFSSAVYKRRNGKTYPLVTLDHIYIMFPNGNMYRSLSQGLYTVLWRIQEAILLNLMRSNQHCLQYLVKLLPYLFSPSH